MPPVDMISTVCVSVQFKQRLALIRSQTVQHWHNNTVNKLFLGVNITFNGTS